MTFTPDQYAALKAKIVEANPDLWFWKTPGDLPLPEGRTLYCEDCGKMFDPPCMSCGCRHGTTRTARPIRLADVLLALRTFMEEQGNGVIDIDLSLSAMKATEVLIGKVVNDWNLRADSLDDQSDETKAFLHSLLCS